MSLIANRSLGSSVLCSPAEALCPCYFQLKSDSLALPGLVVPVGRQPDLRLLRALLPSAPSSAFCILDLGARVQGRLRMCSSAFPQAPGFRDPGEAFPVLHVPKQGCSQSDAGAGHPSRIPIPLYPVPASALSQSISHVFGLPSCLLSVLSPLN